MRRGITSVFLLLIVTALALAIAACSEEPEPTNTPTSAPEPANTPTSVPSEPLSVVASIYPMQYFAERIGGDRVEVETIVRPGTEAHGFELTASDLLRIGGADVVVTNGLTLLPWLDRAIESLGDDLSGIVVEAAFPEAALPAEEGADPDGHEDEDEHGPMEEGEHEDEHEDEEEGEHEDEHEDEDEDEHEDEHGHEEEDGHEDEHGEFDPHFWLDPLRAVSQAERIAEALIEADPEGAETYRANLAALSADLRALHAEFEAGLSSCVHREFVTSHSAYAYLALAYDLEQVGIAGLSPEPEPSPQRLAAIADRIKDLGITAVLLEPVLSGANEQALADETGAGIYQIHAIESVTLAELDEHGDYLGLMRDNLNSLRIAMECS